MLARLEKIEISNFKTFIGTSVIGPLNQRTVIIAPNGSGKSNFFDALAFGLGEQRNHQLRITHLSELIPRSNVGTEQFETSVSLILSLNEELQKVFKRTLVESSNDQYKSEYWIDGEIMSVDDYLRSLKKYGINMDIEDFLVYQGKITDVIGASPKERTELFEKASGSIELKQEYNESQRMLRDLEAKIVAKNEAKLKLQREFRKWQGEIDKVNYANQKREELKSKISEHYLLQLKVIDLQYEEVQQDEAEAEASLKESRTITEQYNGNQTRTLIETIGQKREEKLRIEQQLKELKENLSLKMSEKSKCDDDVAKKKQLIEKENQRQVELNQIRQCIKDNEELDQKYADDLKQYENITKEIESEYRQLCEEVEEQMTSLPELRGIEWAKRKHQLAIAHLESKLVTLNNKMDGLQELIAAKDLAVTNYKGIIKKWGDELKKLMQDRDDKLKNCLSDEKRESLIQKQQKIDAQLENYQVSVESERKRADKKETLDKLKEHLPRKVYGRIYELCQVIHNKYKLAVTTALNRSMHSIVVEDNATAIACLRYLDQQKCGLETIYSINGLQSYDISREYDERKFPNVKLVYDTIKYDQKYEPVVKNIVKSTLICESLDEAWKLRDSMKYKCDIVTVTGEMLSRNGTVTGGYSERKTQSGMIDAVGEKALQNEREMIRKQLTQDSNGLLKLSIDKLQSEIEQKKRLRENLKIMINKIIAEQKPLLKKLEDYKASKFELEESQSANLKKLQNSEYDEAVYQEKLRAIREEKFSDFCTRMDVPNISQFEEKLSKKQEIDENSKQVKTHLEELGNEEKLRTISSEHRNINKWQKQLEDLSGKQKNLQLNCENLKKKKEEVEKKMKKFEKTFCENQKELADTEKEMSQLAQSERTQKRKRNNAVDRKNELIKFRSEIIFTARTEDITLPERERSSSSQSSVEDCQKEFDYSCLNTGCQKSRNITQLQEEMKKCGESIENLRSKVSDYKVHNYENEVTALRVKMVKMEDQLKPMRKNREEYAKKFDDVKKRRHDLFNAFLRKTRELVDRIYKDFYHSVNAQAILLEEDLEEPYLGGINYDCIPPGKRSDAKNLSGGEKTIGGLVLLFALQESHSAPFVILDEVDGALDPKNIQRLLLYMKKFKNSRQILMISHNTAVNVGSDTILCIAPDMRSGYLKSCPILINYSQQSGTVI